METTRHCESRFHRGVAISVGERQRFPRPSAEGLGMTKQPNANSTDCFRNLSPARVSENVTLKEDAAGGQPNESVHGEFVQDESGPRIKYGTSLVSGNGFFPRINPVSGAGQGAGSE